MSDIIFPAEPSQTPSEPLPAEGPPAVPPLVRTVQWPVLPARSSAQCVVTLLVLQEVRDSSVGSAGKHAGGLILSPNPAPLFCCPFVPLAPTPGWRERGEMMRGEPRPRAGGGHRLGSGNPTWGPPLPLWKASGKTLWAEKTEGL